ncbi:hypothetical protein MPER_08952, partial [Moniliophthora perniciosa FA553]
HYRAVKEYLELGGYDPLEVEYSKERGYPIIDVCDLAVDLGMRASNPGRELFGYHLSYLMKRNPDLYQHLDTSQPPKEEHYYGLDFRLRDAPTMKTFLECSHQDQNPDRCREIVNALSDARVAELTDLAREAGSNFLVTVCEDVKKQRSSEAASQALQDLAKAKHPKEVMDKDARSAMAASEEEYEQMLRANPQVYEIFVSAQDLGRIPTLTVEL